MKRLQRKQLIQGMLLAVAVTLVVTGCDLLLGGPLSEQQRLDAFLADANQTPPRDYVAMQSHFSTAVSAYSSLNTKSFWDDSFFNDAQQPFSVSGEAVGGAHTDFPGSTTITGSITNSIGTYPFEFVFVDDPSLPDNHLIRAILIDVGDPTQDEDIRSVAGDPAPVEPDETFEGWELR
jgi:hypothetical protein